MKTKVRLEAQLGESVMLFSSDQGASFYLTVAPGSTAIMSFPSADPIRVFPMGTTPQQALEACGFELEKTE